MTNYKVGDSVKLVDDYCVGGITVCTGTVLGTTDSRIYVRGNDNSFREFHTDTHREVGCKDVKLCSY